MYKMHFALLSLVILSAAPAFAKGSATVTFNQAISVTQPFQGRFGAAQTELGGNSRCSLVVESMTAVEIAAGRSMSGDVVAVEHQQQFSSDEKSTGKVTRVLFSSDDRNLTVEAACFTPGFLFFGPEDLPTVEELMKMAAPFISISK